MSNIKKEPQLSPVGWGFLQRIRPAIIDRKKLDKLWQDHDNAELAISALRGMSRNVRREDAPGYKSSLISMRKTLEGLRDDTRNLLNEECYKLGLEVPFPLREEKSA